jgi:signal transduction histidine kinase
MGRVITADYNWSLVSLFSSLTNRIFVASALLAVLSIAVGIYRVNVAVTSRAEEELLHGLSEARALIEENRRMQVEFFTRNARFIADLPVLKAGMGDGDPRTALGVVEGYQGQLVADLFMVTDGHGRVLARVPDAGPVRVTAEALPGLQRVLAGQEASAFVAFPGGILQVISVPVWITPEAPEILGTLSLGFSLDRQAAARFRELTNSEIAFGLDGSIQASTLPAAGWSTLSTLLTGDGLSKSVWLGDSDYIAMTVPLASDVATVGPQRVALRDLGPGAKAIILRSRTERLAFLRSLHTSMLFIAGVAVLAATVLSYGIARTVTRPLGTITATMREMSTTGDLTRKIPLPEKRRWEDEDARLLATTFNTMTESIERFQREASQRERLSSLGRLSTVVAHEIRNPLMIIKAALRALRKDDVRPADVKLAVTDIDEEIARLNHIVSEVLDFARPIKFELALTDLNALCSDAVKASGVEAGALAVGLMLEPALPQVSTDAERLRLVLVNVLSNARHAVAARNGDVRPANAIMISTARAGDSRVAIEVKDRGAGIKQEDLPKVFDPYFTTRRTGTGLGLAISRNIVEGLRGTINIVSRSGKGTTVRIELPVH